MVSRRLSICETRDDLTLCEGYRSLRCQLSVWWTLNHAGWSGGPLHGLRIDRSGRAPFLTHYNSATISILILITNCEHQKVYPFIHVYLVNHTTPPPRSFSNKYARKDSISTSSERPDPMTANMLIIQPESAEFDGIPATPFKEGKLLEAAARRLLDSEGVEYGVLVALPHVTVIQI